MSASVKKAPMSSGSASAQRASSAARPVAAARFSAAMPGDQPANGHVRGCRRDSPAVVRT
jgi:hypothetical protein